MLADAEVEVASLEDRLGRRLVPRVLRALDRTAVLDQRVRRRREVRRTADDERSDRGEVLDHLARQRARGDRLVALRRVEQRGLVAVRQAVRPLDFPLLGELRIAGGPILHRPVPLLARAGELLRLPRKLRADFVGDVERRLRRPPEGFLRRAHLFLAERRAVRLRHAPARCRGTSASPSR